MDRGRADASAPTTFLMQVSSQCADVPLACFIVATFAVAFGDVLRSPGPGSRLPVVVAGATSAMAAWTKNEGLVFALLMLLVAGCCHAAPIARPLAERDGSCCGRSLVRLRS